jgi:hypothetical protein
MQALGKLSVKAAMTIHSKIDDKQSTKSSLTPKSHEYFHFVPIPTQASPKEWPPLYNYGYVGNSASR